MYLLNHGKAMTPGAFAQMIATMLYGKRFFPYYISNILVSLNLFVSPRLGLFAHLCIFFYPQAGLDENGQGVVYSYDPVGHVEKHFYRAGGSSVSLLQPMLDNQVGKKNMPKEDPSVLPTLEEAVNLVRK